MEDFTSQNLQLVLGVKEGTNFDRVQKPTVVIATLNGHSLQSKIIHPDANPQYTTDLKWETDRNALRKMRCNQSPIKIECYAVNDNGSREKLGYILLSVRCAQIIHRGKESEIKTTWHNILGVRNEFNNCKPKLLLYLIIKEKETKPSNTVSKDADLFQLNLNPINIVPIWVQEERFIQLGPLDTCQDIFLLHVIAEVATNLDLLVEGCKEINNSNECFLFYNILDTSIRLKPFKLQSKEIFLNEKIVIRIRTSLNVLLNFLNLNPHFLIKLKCNNITLSQVEVNLKPLLNTNNIEEFRLLNKNSVSTMDHYCILKNINSKEIKGDYRRGDEPDKLPSLKLHIKFQYLEPKDSFNERNIHCFHNSPRIQQPRNNVTSLTNNHYLLEEQTVYTNFQKDIDPKFYQQAIENLEKNSRIPPTLFWDKVVHFDEEPLVRNVKPSHCPLSADKEINSKFEDDIKTYCFNIYLNSIKFYDSRPDIKEIEFRFYYPQGEMITAICNNVQIVAEQTLKLQDVKCKLPFVSNPSKIEQIITRFAPKINICDATSAERQCIAQVSLDIQNLFNQTMGCQYEAILIDCHNQHEIGCINITATLEDDSIQTKPKEIVSDTLLDNSVAYKIVDELETWKERQKEIFKEELRKKEETHLTLLNEEWQRRRQCLETKLTNSIQQCKVLANNLNKTTEGLRLRKIQSLEKETKLIQENEELQWKCDRKLHQLQDALQKMQEEFTAKLVHLEEQNQNLIMQIEVLSSKKYELEKMTNDQAKKLEVYEKASLTKDQTATVLQQMKILEEKLDNAKKSKSFFKEQWGKAVKEIHRIKTENQQTLNYHIKSSKEELDNLDLEEILHADSTALTYDQFALNEIQREIDILNPENSMPFFKTTSDQFPQHSDLCLNLDQNNAKSDISLNSSSSDKKLNTLIEQRDSLLKSGNYTSDDGIIIKLNAEIRSTLMNS